MQTLPAYEYGRLAQRWVSAPEPITWSQPVPYSVHAYYDLKAFSLFGIVFPGVKAHFDPFLGVVALSLALLAVTALWRDSRVRLLAALALAAILYALGHNSVFQGALYGLIPQLDKARSPSSAMVLFQFACAALAAFGIDRLATSWTARGTWMLTAFGTLTLAIAQFVIFANKLTFPADDRVILTAVIALLAAALFAAWRRQALTSTQAHVLLVLLLLLELGNSAQYNLADRSDRGQMQWLDQIHSNADIAEYLRKQPGFQRAEIAGDAFKPNWGAFHGVEMHGGMGAGVTINVVNSELFSLMGRRMYGVAYTIAREPPPDAGDLVFTGASGMKVYRRDAFPRAWAVHELVRVPNAGEGNLLVVREPESIPAQGSHGGAAPARANLRRARHRPTHRTRARPPRHPRRDGLRRSGGSLRYLPPRLARARRSPPGRNLRSQWRDARRGRPPRDAHHHHALPPRQRLSGRGAVPGRHPRRPRLGGLRPTSAWAAVPTACSGTLTELRMPPKCVPPT